MQTPLPLITTGPADGTHLSVIGNNYRIVISGKQTGGAYAAIEMNVPPGGGPGPHAHAAIQEAFYVLEGSVEVRNAEQTYTAEKGALINIPLGGMVHQFKNRSTKMAKLLCIVTPAGLEDFFMEIGKPVKAGEFLPAPVMDEAEKQRMNSIAEKYGQQLFPPNYFD